MASPAHAARLIATGVEYLLCMRKGQREQALRSLRKLRLPKGTASDAERTRIAAALHSLIASGEAVHTAGAKGRVGLPQDRQGEREYRELRERLTTESLSRREAAQRLGLSEQQISNLVKNGHLLALEVRRSLRIPRFQFDLRQRKGYLPGLRAVSRAYGGPPLAVLEWLTARNPGLEGRTPAAALAVGLVERVAELATVGQSQV